jgi:hypothetical protein
MDPDAVGGFTIWVEVQMVDAEIISDLFYGGKLITSLQKNALLLCFLKTLIG